MIVAAFLIGMGFPTLSGWLLVRLVEGHTPLLLRSERWAMGFLLGLTTTMYGTFLVSLVGLPLTLTRFLAVQGCTLLLLLWIARRRLGTALRAGTVPLSPSPAPHLWIIVLLILLGVWTATKIGAGAYDLLTMPPGFDDTVKNWDMRGKIIFVTHTLGSTAPGSSQDLLGELKSYPPTVSLAKAWLASIAGTWNQGLVDSVHVVWFLCLLALLYAALRRRTSATWALIGVYLLASLPLELIHGTQAYADVFLSAHLFVAVSMLSAAAEADHPSIRAPFLRLACLNTALLPLTKNEGLVLYLPIVLLLSALTLWWGRSLPSARAEQRSVLRNLVIGCCVFVLPWLLYKWTHHFSFGNAKAISDTTFSWQPLAALSASILLFFEGNWLLLFPLLLILCIFHIRELRRPSTAVVATFVLLGFLAQQPIFLLTNLSTEVLMGTGYARGIVHLLPAAVLLLTLLLQRTAASAAEPIDA